MWLNVGYAGAELAAYFTWGSLSMLTDAFHNGSDVIALLIALYCERMKRPATAARESTQQRMTFGPKRFEAIGGWSRRHSSNSGGGGGATEGCSTQHAATPSSF